MAKPARPKNPLDTTAETKAEQAPVYQTTRLLTLVCWRIRAQMQKDMKHVTGPKLIDACQGLMESILWTYIQGDQRRKMLLARSLLKRTARIRAILRSVFDTDPKFRSLFVEAAEHLNSIERQINGWPNRLATRAQQQ